ncbi:MAG: enoyl-CoA hydratase-related protein [Marinifilaceae bacterium]|jgi:methylglutaconyl-CoA hydratase|nr:enoyl-CoA hydratase-related protein [Marinifilaceae bacterium]
MKKFNTIVFEIDRDIIYLKLNRPKLRNAFNSEMITEIIYCLEEICEKYTDKRLLVIASTSDYFCAGADLNWMKSAIGYTYDKNLDESQQLAKCFRSIYDCPIPTMSIVKSCAIGGANGILAACDFVMAHKDSVFSLSEVKIGLVPACISPYIIKRVGEFKARELMISGKRIKTKYAKKIGLVNYSFSDHSFETKFNKLISLILTSAPEAIRESKILISTICNNSDFIDIDKYTSEFIAKTRMKEEAQEGMRAFLEKRKAKWNLKKEK